MRMPAMTPKKTSMGLWPSICRECFSTVAKSSFPSWSIFARLSRKDLKSSKSSLIKILCSPLCRLTPMESKITMTAKVMAIAVKWDCQPFTTIKAVTKLATPAECELGIPPVVKRRHMLGDRRRAMAIGILRICEIKMAAKAATSG